MTTLYLCYQSVLEPLTQTQVVAYLEGLVLAGFKAVLLTFEPRPLSDAEVSAWRDRLSAKGIAWHWLRYHKWPTVPATAWDIAAGIATGLGLIRKYRVRLLHARCHVPGLMALALKRLTGAKFLFDLRGFMAEEYVDAGVWPAGGSLFRMTKRAERALVEAADAVVVLTDRAKTLLQQWYPQAAAAMPVEVIPCCADLRQVPTGVATAKGEQTLVYAGKLGGWYLTEAMVKFASAAREVFPALHWNVWTQSDAAPLRQLVKDNGLVQHVSIGRVSPIELPLKLRRASMALSFIKPCLSKLASSPTKVGEYLAAGLPVVSTSGIGDLDALLSGHDGDDGAPVGVVLRDCTSESYREGLAELCRLLDDPGTPERCRRAAARHFDLERVGWPRYRKVYEAILGEPNRT